MTAPLRIAIVGGVAGGASAATRARRCNEHAQITLFEKDSHVSFANCGLPYYIGQEIAERSRLLVATPELFRDRFRIDARVRHEVVRIDRSRKVIGVVERDSGRSYEHAYDKLILAPGASPLVPPIDGFERANVFTLRNLEDTDRIRGWVDNHGPRSAVVVGAGFIGLEMVEQLARRGLRVTLVELQDQVLPPLDREMARFIEREARSQSVEVRLGDSVAAILGEGPVATGVRTASGAAIDADLVIVGVGVRPNVGLATDAGLELGAMGGIRVDEFLRTSDPDIYAAGDAVEYLYGPTMRPLRVPLAGPANRAGRIAGEHAATGRSSPLAPVWGTAIVRIFNTTAAMTGLTRKQAARSGIDAASVTITANHHAGYYPGAAPMRLKLVYAPDTGLVLGAQAVGGEGVDKRIDVIATAMSLRATVRDLAGLDLAYAPPFGSAKDPIHMAAFAAMNHLDGWMDYVEPDADLSGMQVVDVRSPKEVMEHPLPGADHAINIPLNELRDRVGELDPARPTVASCASGLRSYNAARILRQHGLPGAASLTGGQSLRAVALRDEEAVK